MKSSEEAGKRAGGETSASACEREGRPCGGGRVPGEWPRAAAGKEEERGGEAAKRILRKMGMR